MCFTLEYSEVPNVDFAEFILKMLLKIMKILIFTHILKKYINGIRENVQNFRTKSISEKLKN
jgi:hypothetical protein